jgi:hypothetical protein
MQQLNGLADLRKTHLRGFPNEGTVKESVTLRNLTGPCDHYSLADVGDPVLVDL